MKNPQANRRQSSAPMPANRPTATDDRPLTGLMQLVVAGVSPQVGNLKPGNTMYVPARRVSATLAKYEALGVVVRAVGIVAG